MKNRYFPILSLILLLAGCYEDKGSYDYLPAKKISITTSEITSFYLGEKLEYSPVITIEGGTEDEFEFWWDYTGTTTSITENNFGSGTEIVRVCNTRDLLCHPEVTGRNIYRVYAKERATGVITSAALVVNVSSQFEKGWAVLSSDNGRSVLSFMRPESIVEGSEVRNTYVAFPDIYGSLYPDEPLGTGPQRLKAQYASAEVGGSSIFIFQDSRPYVLNGKTFKREMYFDDMFIGDLPSGFETRDLHDDDYISLVLARTGEVYTRHALYNDLYGYSFSTYPVKFEDKVLKIERFYDDHRARNTCGMPMLDRQNRRILWCGTNGLLVSNMTGQIYGMIGFAQDEDYEFDYGNFGDLEPLYIYASTGNYIQSYMKYVVIYRKDGKVRYQLSDSYFDSRLYYRFMMRYVSYYDFPGEVAEDTIFMGVEKMPTIMFFSKGSNLYWTDLNTRQVTLFHAFPEGSRIVDMARGPAQAEMGVALEDGTFAVFDISANNLSQKRIIYQTTLPAPIVDIEYIFSDYVDMAGN